MGEFLEAGSGKRDFRERINWILREFSFRNDRKRILFLAESIGIILIISEIFYSSLLAAIFLSPLLFPIYIGRKRRNDDRKRQELMLEFKECMNSVVTGLKAGYSAENAFREAEGEMEYLYGKGSPICMELAMITGGLDNSVSLEILLSEFADRSGIGEIRDFAEIFVIARKSGGSLSEIMSETVAQIQSRIEVEREIDVLVSSRRLEQHIMDVVPFAIIIYIGISTKGFFDVLYHNPGGVVIMSLCLAVYCVAVVISERILAIRV